MRSLPLRDSSRLTLLPLIRTLVDITLLRKGPEAIPNSWVLLYMSVGLWLLALLATVGLIANFDASNAWVGLGSGIVGWTCYVLVLVGLGFGARTLPTLSAIVGSGAIISFLMLLAFVILTPTLGSRIADLVAFFVLVWSVPVKGNIIARAINWHWYAGIVIAFSIFILQLVFTQYMSSQS